MSIPFLQAEIERLTEPAAVALLQQIQHRGVVTPLSQQPIQTPYVRQGETGAPILLLHGFDSSLLEFRRLLPLLAGQHQVWAVDLLGFGFSDRPVDIPMSPLAIKTHLYAVWQTLIQQPVVLVGASMGGAAAIDFALAHPEAVRKLVLIDSAGYRGGPPIGRFLVPPLGYLATAFLRHPRVRRQISCSAYHDPAFATADAQLCAALHLTQPRWRQSLIAFARSGGYGSFRGKLADLELPTLILWGESDRILGTQDAEGLHAAIPNSKLIWIPACGHVPHLEQPQLTAQHLLNFMNS